MTHQDTLRKRVLRTVQTSGNHLAFCRDADIRGDLEVVIMAVFLATNPVKPPPGTHPFKDDPLVLYFLRHKAFFQAHWNDFEAFVQAVPFHGLNQASMVLWFENHWQLESNGSVEAAPLPDLF